MAPVSSTSTAQRDGVDGVLQLIASDQIQGDHSVRKLGAEGVARANSIELLGQPTPAIVRAVP